MHTYVKLEGGKGTEITLILVMLDAFEANL